ncbi:alpha/beta hydrolase family protein, partial [bacterium]|nr:alpha/beta hydrolase family protein [bacterium]
MELYNYDNNKSEYEYDIKPESLVIKKTNENYLKYILTFKSPYVSSSDINNNVYSELFLKEDFFKKNVNFSSPDKNLILNEFKFYNKEIPFVILLHGFSTGNEKLKTYYNFMYNMLDKNIACLFINLPFHLKRRPHNEASGRRLIYYDDLGTLIFFHQCVVDVRKSINIIDNILSPKTITICGISLGSMISTITMALEKKIDKGILILGGGNWEEIHWNGILRFMLKGNCAGDEIISREKCHQYYLNFPKFLEKLIKINPDKLTTSL